MLCSSASIARGAPARIPGVHPAPRTSDRTALRSPSMRRTTVGFSFTATRTDAVRLTSLRPWGLNCTTSFRGQSPHPSIIGEAFVGPSILSTSLAAMAHELTCAAIVVCDIGKRGSATDDERKRLLEAARRFSDAAEVAHGG